MTSQITRIDNVLKRFDAYIKDVDSAPQQIDISYGGYNSAHAQYTPLTMSISFKNRESVTRLFDAIVAAQEYQATLEKQMKKYPALKEAYEHFKSIEALCSQS